MADDITSIEEYFNRSRKIYIKIPNLTEQNENWYPCKPPEFKGFKYLFCLYELEPLPYLERDICLKKSRE